MSAPARLRAVPRERRLAISLSARSGLSPPQLGEMARQAEDAGCAAVFVTEHLSDSVTVAAALLAATRDVVVGTTVTVIAGRNPTLLARSASALDEWSHGRFLLGLGTGNPTANRALTGEAWTSPVARMEEFVGAWRAAVRDVPLMVGAIQSRMVRAAAGMADVVLLNFAGVERARACAQAIRGSNAPGEGDATPLVGCVIPCLVGASPAVARRVAAEMMRAYMDQPAIAAHVATLGEDEVAAEVLLAGDVPACQARLAAYREAGVDLPVLFPVAGADGWSASMAGALELARI